MNEGYHDYLVKRFHEETQGEALFRTLAEETTDAGQERKWRTLQRLEKETKERLAAELATLGAPIAEDPAVITEGISQGRQFSSLPCLEFLAILGPALDRFLVIFERAELEAGEGWNPQLLRHVTRHERALRAFVTCECEGRGEGSLDEVLALLAEAPAGGASQAAQ